MEKNPLSLNNQHDYITLRTPNGNFTFSWYSSKATGKLSKHPTAFNKMYQFVETETKRTNTGKC